MKHIFLSRLYDGFRRDVAGVVEELYASRFIACLNVEQEQALEVCRWKSMRMNIFRNVYGCCMLIENILEDDIISEHIDIMMSESPRVENWSIVKILAPALVHIIQTFYVERRAA